MATLCGMFESVQLIFYLFEEIFDLPYEFYPKEFSSIELSRAHGTLRSTRYIYF